MIKTSKINTYFCFFLCFIFVSFALLQLNDPDPLTWFSIYFLISGFCVLVPFVKVQKLLLKLVILGLSVYAITYFKYVWGWLQTSHKEEIFGKMVYEKPYLEGSREFLGLVIGIGAMVYLNSVNNKE
ncbi:transmembrane 220 family protein [Wenyingzhuangia sp. 2_MG-2023]|uniref:transmembrane 220 family protein n=1 Tax=Wenyingzhuangia sp. 2_MG-2023 TaxID=3062639 RepID=UPI0026E259BF|nr:transmembrane 220 family protein [Wenyingzhuangia sp. 2_MG-2023]MDO6739101.1 transmembrane 220 family protein [Wenyingzhuangia sp. 2_MG-2023]